MWYGVGASVRKLPSARFRTWPWNGEFLRRACLAVGCWSFAAAGAEKKDLNMYPKRPTLNRYQTQPTLSQKNPKGDQNTITSRCREKKREKVTKESAKATKFMLFARPMLDRTSIRLEKNAFKKSSNKRSRRNMDITPKGFQNGLEIDATGH